MTLELSQLTKHVWAMGEEVAARERQRADRVELARLWLEQYADRGEELRLAAREARAAIPTDEPLDAAFPQPPVPDRFTFIAADGSHINPDRHAAALYHLVNVGSLVYRHGSGEPPQADSSPALGYTEAELYEEGTLVAGPLLDLKRDLAELTRLADLCEIEPDRPSMAVVDGTLILGRLEELPPEGRQGKIDAYLHQLDRIRESGVGVAAFISRPRHGGVGRLLHLANVEGDVSRAGEEPNPLQHLPDAAIFQALPPGARSALFVSSSPVNQKHYRLTGHTIYFCYLNLAEEGRGPVISRIELPAWVARDADRLAFVHAAIVSQARITGDYPYALARADELAFISGPEREALGEMVSTALLRAGVQRGLSPKAYYKTLTRRGRRKHHV